MKPKNTICLWFDKNAHEAARFYGHLEDDWSICGPGQTGHVVLQGTR